MRSRVPVKYQFSISLSNSVTDEPLCDALSPIDGLFTKSAPPSTTKDSADSADLAVERLSTNAKRDLPFPLARGGRAWRAVGK
jgi:hypothetical protein